MTKKTWKRLAAIVLALVMCMANMAMVFAAPEQKTLTVNKAAEGHTYTAYQILKGEVDGTKLINLDWGTGINETGKAKLIEYLELEANATVAQVADGLSKITSDSAKMDAVAQILGDNKAGSGTVLSGENGTVSATVDQGYYVIIDTLGDGAAAEDTVSKYMVQVVGDVTVESKAQPTTSQKTVKDGDDAKAEFTEANIGEERTFYLTAKLPADYAAYDYFYLKFNDTMNNMDFAGITSVTVKKDVTSDENGKLDPATGTEVATIAEANYTLTAPEDSQRTAVWNLVIEDLKTVVTDAEAGNCVIVEYKAKLNANAVMNGANENTFTLDFSNDPNSTVKPDKENPGPTGTTPEDQADLYTTEIELLKYDGTTNEVLQGAEFTLTGETTDVVIKTATVFEEVADGAQGEYWKLKNDSYTKDAPTADTLKLYEVTDVDAPANYILKTTTEVVAGKTSDTEIKAMVGADGKVIFSGLGVGSYKLSETKVPTGYNQMEDISFDITFNKDTMKFEGTNIFAGKDTLNANIPNYSGSTLPSTGGIGTTIFYVVGGILVAGAIVLLVTKKRMGKQA